MKAFQLFLFGLLVAALTALVYLFHPRDGISVLGFFRLEFPTAAESFAPANDSVEQVLHTIIAESSIHPAETQRRDSLSRRAGDSLRMERIKLRFPPGRDGLLDEFFGKLAGIATASEPLHIVHYGDSQIEGDRITDFLRYKLQSRFGGSGPGWMPVEPYVESRSFFVEAGPEWETRYLFGKRDSTVGPDRFGPLGSVSFYQNGDAVDAASPGAWVEYRSRAEAYPTVKKFSRIRLFYGNCGAGSSVQLEKNGRVLTTAPLEATKEIRTFEHLLNFETWSIGLRLTGSPGPDVYGVSLESMDGVIVSNVGMRGRSGVFFRELPGEHFSLPLQRSNTGLIILQFGGNILPYADSEQDVRYYAERYKRNIQFLQKHCPEAAILVIGPADMARKEGVEWKSFPYLPILRDALEEVAHECGAAFWDPLTAMGGMGAIDQWVQADPPLALQDHVHFTEAGGDLIARWLYEALMTEYEAFLDENELQ